MRLAMLFVPMLLIGTIQSVPALGAPTLPEVDALLKTHGPDAPAISVAVTKDGVVVYRGAFGSAYLENGIPATPDSRFEIGSVAKMFTALAVERLIQAGKIPGTTTSANIFPACRPTPRRSPLHNCFVIPVVCGTIPSC